MKRILAISVSLLLILTFLSACTTGTTTTMATTATTAKQTTTVATTTVATTTTEPIPDFKGDTVTFVNWGSSSWNGPGDEAETNYRTEAAKKYNFKWEYIAITDADYLPTLTSSTIAGDPVADIATFMNDGIPPLAAKGLLVPLDTIKAFDFVNGFEIVQGDREALTWTDGHVYGYQFNRGGFLDSKIFDVFNKEIASALGYDFYALAASGDYTWDKFFEAAAKATQDTNNDGKNEKFGFAGDLNLMAMGYVGSTGAEALSADLKVQYNDPRIAAALTEYARIKPYYNAPPEGASWDYYMLTFPEGNTLFDHGNQWWNVSRYYQMTADYGIIPFPFQKKGDPLRTYSDIDGCQGFLKGASDPEFLGFVVKLLRAYRPWQLDEKGVLIVDFNSDDFFRSQYEANVRDTQSLEWLLKFAKYSEFKMDKQRMFNIYWSNPGFSQLASDVWTGTMTAAQAIEANQAPTQAKLDAYLAEISKTS